MPRVCAPPRESTISLEALCEKGVDLMMAERAPDQMVIVIATTMEGNETGRSHMRSNCTPITNLPGILRDLADKFELAQPVEPTKH